MHESFYYTSRELAERWSFTTSTIHKMAQRGALPYLWVNRRYRFPKSDIHRMENARGR